MKTSQLKAAAGAFALAAAVIAATPANAQQSEVALLRDQIKALQDRLDKIEADSKKTADAVAKSAPSVSSNSKLPVTVSGLFQIQSINTFSQNGAVAPSPDTFRIRRGEIRITAPKITDRVSGTIQLDPAKASFRSRVTIPAIPAVIPPGGIPAANVNTDSRARDSILQEVQISYLLNKQGDRSNYIDVGQYKIPIGYESLQSSGSLPLVERSLIFSQRDPFDGSYGDQRDTGVQLRGTAGKIDYRLGVFNGFGDRQNALALSDPKAVLGRIAFRPNADTEIGISGGRGNTGSAAGAARTDRSLLNAFGAWKKGKLSLQGEYLTGDAQLQTGASVRDIKGYYGQIGYRFRPKIEGIFRYDYLDANRQAAAGVDSTVRDLILGVNYYIKGNNAKIQTNLVKRSGAGGLAPQPSGVNADIVNDKTELRTSFQVQF